MKMLSREGNNNYIFSISSACDHTRNVVLVVENLTLIGLLEDISGEETFIVVVVSIDGISCNGFSEICKIVLASICE